MTNDRFHGGKTMAGDLYSYTARKEELKLEFQDTNGVITRFTLAEYLNIHNWWDEVDPFTSYISPFGGIYTLKLGVDLSDPAIQVPLTDASVATFFDNATGENMTAVSTLPKFVKIPITLDFGTMTAGAIFPSFGASSNDFIKLPMSERYISEDLRGSYKPIEIQARLVNSTATPMTFDIQIGTDIISAINVTYSPTLTVFPIPVTSQSPTTTARVQIGISIDATQQALEAYVIYELI